MKASINILYSSTLAAVLLLSGCEKQELQKMEEPVIEDKDKQEVQFKFFVEEGDRIIPYQDYWNAVNPPLPGPVSRATGDELPNNFTLYGVYNTVDVPDGKGAVTSTEGAPSNKRFFDGITANADGTYTGDRRFWVVDGKTRHSFAAIAGLSTSAGSNMLYKGFTTDCFIPVATHYIAKSPNDQTDLLVAYGPTNVVVDGVIPVVNIYFKHALSKLLFKVTSSGGISLYDCVLSITYNQVIQAANCYYNTVVHSNLGAQLSGTYALGTGGVTIPTTANSEATAIVMGDAKVHAAGNQPDGWLYLSLSYAKSQGGAKTTLRTKLPAQNLMAGIEYCYYVYVSEISESLSIAEIVIKPWTTEVRMADPLN